MKNRRNIIVAFMLCACLIMGIGYAAFSDVMDITGVSELNADEVADGNIIFISATAANNLDSANVNVNNKDKASFTVKSVVSQGEQATFTFVIENTNADAHKIKFRAVPAGINDDATNYYSITSTLSNGGTTVQGTDTTTEIDIAGGNGQVTVTVVVTMTNTPPDGELISANFLIELAVRENTSGASVEG